MILSGRLYDAEQALEQGLVHLCVPDADLENGVGNLLNPF